MQKELQKILNTTVLGLKQLSKKITEIADVVKEDAIYGLRIGKLKLKELNLERKKAAKIYAIGRRTYALYKQGRITDAETCELCDQLTKLEAIAKKYHGTAEKLKKARK